MMSYREFDALYPRRETGFESPYDPADLDFDFPPDEWNVPLMNGDEPGGEVNTVDELLKRIEEARHDMHQLAERCGLTAPQVMEQSRRLDELLNTYYQMKERISA